jgi:hypothetical protein
MKSSRKVSEGLLNPLLDVWCPSEVLSARDIPPFDMIYGKPDRLSKKTCQRFLAISFSAKMN